MKILVISDSHGNIANLKHVMGFARKIEAGVVIHCGDWDTNEAVEEVLSHNIPVYSVLGNADIDPTISEKFDKEHLEFGLDGKKIGVVHRLTIYNQRLMINCDIIFSGHFHSQFDGLIKGLHIVRPGALEGSVNFAIYNTNTDKVEFVHE